MKYILQGNAFVDEQGMSYECLISQDDHSKTTVYPSKGAGSAYFNNSNQFHREEGPAYVFYDFHWDITMNHYYWNGKMIYTAQYKGDTREIYE